jgi:ribosomal-protein-alanine N-acetyltransferase
VRIHEVGTDFYAPWLGARSTGQSWGDIFDISLAKGANDANVRLVGEAADGRIAGLFNLNEIVRGFFENAYASWQVSPEFAGQGYATEGVTALLDIAFSKEAGPGLHRVQANVIPTNVRSVRLAERVGFRKEGLAQKYLKIAGQWQDHVMFAKVVDEHRPTYLGRKES